MLLRFFFKAALAVASLHYEPCSLERRAVRFAHYSNGVHWQVRGDPAHLAVAKSEVYTRVYCISHIRVCARGPRCRGSERRGAQTRVGLGQSWLLSICGVEQWGFTLNFLCLWVIRYFWTNPKFLFPATYQSTSVSVRDGPLQRPLQQHMILVIHRDEWGDTTWRIMWGSQQCLVQHVSGGTLKGRVTGTNSFQLKQNKELKGKKACRLLQKSGFSEKWRRRQLRIFCNISPCQQLQSSKWCILTRPGFSAAL